MSDVQATPEVPEVPATAVAEPTPVAPVVEAPAVVVPSTPATVELDSAHAQHVHGLFAHVREGFVEFSAAIGMLRLEEMLKNLASKF